MRRSSWYAAAAVAALTFAATAAAHLLHQSHALDERITSVALNGEVHARVILPAQYDDLPHRRFPVIYFLHGLAASASTYRSNTWLADAMAKVGPAIVVLPQGARDADTDPEYLNWGSGRNWESYIARDRRAVRRRLRRHDRRTAPPGHVLGDRVVVRLLPPDRPNRDAAARTRPGGERTHPLRRAPREVDVLRLLRRPGRQPVPRGERAGEPRARRRTSPSRLRGLRGQARDSAVAKPRSHLAAACAPASGSADAL